VFVRTPHFGTFFEVAESLKRGPRFVRRDVLARTSGKANVGHPTEALGRALYNFSSEANQQGSCFACHD
jgi:hypothetical protein